MSLFPAQTAIVPITRPITAILWPSLFPTIHATLMCSNTRCRSSTNCSRTPRWKSTTWATGALHLLDRIRLNTPSELEGAQLANCQAAFAGPASDAANAYLANQCPFFARQPLPNFAIPGPLNSSWTGYSNYNAGNSKNRASRRRSGSVECLHAIQKLWMTNPLLLGSVPTELDSRAI